MNKPYNVLATLNNNLEKVRSYTENKDVQAKRETVFDIIKNHNAVNKDGKLYRGYMPSSHYNYENQKGNYTQSQAVEKINQLENTIKDGWVYTWDTETTGQPVSFNSQNVNKADKLNNGIFSVTELGMSKQQFKDGKPVSELIPVINFTSSHDRKTIEKYIFKAKGDSSVANQTTLSTMTRYAGYSDPSNFSEVNGKKVITGWNGSAKANDETAIGRAITLLTGDPSSNMEKGVQFIVGTKEYNEEVRRIFDVINEEVLNSDNTILSSMNGLNFDNPVLYEFFSKAGIKLDDNFSEKLNNKTIDTQQILRGTSKPKIIKLQNKANVSANMTVENLIHAANEIGAGIKKSDSHVAVNDAGNSAQILNAFMPDIFEARDNIVNDMKEKVPVSTKAIYHANSAVMADDSDLFFIDNGYDNPNVYNNMLMEPGHSYSLESYSFDKNNIPDELKDQAKDFQNKKIIKMEDMYKDYNRSAYLIVDKQSNIQEKFFNNGSIVATTMNNETLDLINKSTESAFIDKARQTRDNFYRVNSDKGINDFETYLSSYKDYATKVENSSKESLFESLKSGVINSYEGNEIATKDALNRLFTRGEDGTLIHERAFNLVNMYDDLESNYDLYSSMVNAAKESVGEYSDFLYNNGLDDGYSPKVLFNKTKTSALAGIKESLNSSVMDILGDEEVLEHVINNNEALSNLVSSRIDKRTAENGTKLNNTVSSKIKREAYKDFFGEGFSKNSKHAQAYVFGKKELEGTLRDFEGIDIKNPNGDFSRIQINDKNKFTSSFKQMLYSGVKSENNIKQANDNLRRNYLRSVVDDLSGRGLIDGSVVEQFKSTDTVQSMIDVITNGVYDTKYKFDKLVTPGKTVNYDKLSPEEFRFVRNYINNSKPNTIYSEANGFSIMGQTANDFVNSRMGNIKEGFVDTGRLSVPRLATYSSIATESDFSIDKMKGMLKSEFKWSNNNIDNFMSKVINNEELRTFEYATSGKKVNGLSHTIMMSPDDGIGYLVSTPFDKQAIVADKIARGVNIDEINNLAVTWRIPKIEELGGVRVIKQGPSSYKAVTQDLFIRSGKLSESNDFGSILDVEDTIDQVINRIGNKYGFAKSKRLMEEGSYIAASNNLNSSWNKINSNKTLSSISTRFEKGINGSPDRIYKQTTLNRADYALPGMIDISDMVYAVDGIKDEKLLSLLQSDVKDYQGIIKEIKGVKENIYGSSRKSFDQWDTTFQLWFSNNVSDIAKDILENKSFAEYTPEATRILNLIQTVGSDGFFGKESGDANRGYFFLNSPRNFVAGSSFSGTSRPLLNQVMSALNVFSEDMIGLSQRRLPINMRKEINNVSDLETKLGIKMGHGYMTEGALKYADVARKLNEGEMGFTTKVKFMGPNEFLDSVNKFIDIDDETFSNLMSDKSHFSKALRDTGVSPDKVTADYIRKIAKNISTATNLHEDSSLITPLLGQILSPKTVTSVKFDGDTSRFKIGDMLNTGDVLFKDTGKKNDKNNGKIVGIEDDKIFIQLNEKYINAKIGTGAEKTEGIAPVVNSIKKLKNGEEAAMAHGLVRELSGGANVIMNPDIVKHESLNTTLSAYFNSIGYGINESNIDEINKSLDAHLSNANMKYVKDGNGRYVLSEGSKIGAVSLYNFDDFIDEIKLKNYDKINSNIRDFEEKGLSYLDLLTMQDNTIENYQGADNIGKGAAISFRSQSVMGAFIGDDNIDELSKYRMIKDGQIENLWQPLIDNDIEQLASDPKFIRAQEQVQNIRVALAESSGEKIAGSKISKFDLDRGAVGSSTMTAETMPEIFKYSTKGDRIHGYEIDISDLNVNIKNYIYSDLTDKNLLNLRYDNKVSQYVSKIFIPALDANHMDEEYILSKTQRAASDLINGINDFRNGNFRGKNIQQASEILDYKYKSYIDALRFDIVSKKGLNKRSQKIKSQYASRVKVSNVAAPVTKDGFAYKDINFANTSTLKVGGKEKYYASVFVSMEDFTNKGLSMKSVGKQVIEENIDDSLEALNILKKNLSGNSELQAAKDMAQARKILKGSNISNKTYESIGINFLEDIGIYGGIMRDPAAKSTSYQPTKVRMGNITTGTIAIDAVTAKAINADVDGDELNIFFRGLMARKNKNGIVETVLRNQDDLQVKTIKNLMEVYSDYNLRSFKNEIHNFKEMGRTRNNIKEYMKEMKILGRDIDNLDYFEGNEKFIGLLTKFTKSSIGQISNPNYYLKAAANSYFASNPYDINAYKGIASINSLTDLTEQKLLDFKGIKFKGDALNVAKLAGSYMESMDGIGSSRKNVNKNSLTAMYRNLLNITNLENEGPLTLGYNKKILQENLDEAVEQAVQRILKGTHYTSNNGTSFTLEESLYNVYQVLKDNKSRDLFFSSYIRQNDIEKVDGEYLNALNKNKRAINQTIDPNNKLAGLMNGYNYLDSTVDLNGKSLFIGESLYSVNDKNGIGEGVFKVSSMKRSGTNNFINLVDTDTNKVTTVNGSSFKSLSEKISHMKRYDDGVNFEKLLSKEYKTKLTSGLDGFYKIDSIINSSSKESSKYKSAINAMSGIDLDNLNDVLNTSAVLKDKGFISESDSTKFIKSMNDNIKKSGTGNYHEAKMQKLLSLDSLKKNAKVSSIPSLNSLLENEVTEESISKVRGSAKISNLKDKINSLSRMDIDKATAFTQGEINANLINNYKFSTLNLKQVNNIRTKTMGSVIGRFSEKDKTVIRELQEIFSNNSEDLNFVTEVLGLKMEEIKSLIDNDAGDKAINLINKSKISYGDYIGFNIGELEDSVLNKIISSEYDTTGISAEIVEKTTEVIKYSQALKENGVIRKVKPIVDNMEMSETITKTMSEINEKIKNGDGKSDSLSGKSIIDKISDLGNKAKSNKKFIFGSLAVAGTAIAGSYIYGNSKMKEKDEQYVSKNSGETYNEDIIKQGEEGTETNSKYEKVPNSNKKFYGNKDGVTVNVSGKAPSEASVSNLNILVSRIFGGASATVNTSISDSRKSIEDRDVEALMSQAVRI